MTYENIRKKLSLPAFKFFKESDVYDVVDSEGMKHNVIVVGQLNDNEIEKLMNEFDVMIINDPLIENRGYIFLD